MHLPRPSFLWGLAELTLLGHHASYWEVDRFGATSTNQPFELFEQEELALEESLASVVNPGSPPDAPSGVEPATHADVGDTFLYHRFSPGNAPFIRRSSQSLEGRRRCLGGGPSCSSSFGGSRMPADWPREEATDLKMVA